MSSNGHAPNGPVRAIIPNGPNDSNAETIPKETRILTVEQAIPYSPFSSIVPFDSDIIPMPSIGLRSSNSIFKGSHQREETRYGLENLNGEAIDPTTSSNNLQRYLSYVRELLHPSGITRYKFKVKPMSCSSSKELQEPQVSLSAFSQMVFDSTYLSFTNSISDSYSKSLKSFDLLKSTPSVSVTRQHQSLSSHHDVRCNNSLLSSSTRSIIPQVIIPSKLPEKKQKTQTERILSPHLTPKPASLRQYELNRKKPAVKNGNEDVQSNTVLTPPVNIPSDSSSKEIVATSNVQQPCISIVTQLPQQLEEDPHQSLESLQPQDTKSPTKPKAHFCQENILSQYEVNSYGNNLTTGCDEREKADIALRNLQEYLQEIIEAEDHLDMNTMDQFFTYSQERGIRLNNNSHIKLDSLIQKVIQLGRFSKVDVNDLTRVQKFCENTLKDTESLDLKIYDSMSEEDVSLWSFRLTSAQLGIRSAHTALRIMAGSREERQIYSEDLTKSALNAFSYVLETCIIPILEIRNFGFSKTLFKLLLGEKKIIIGLLKQCQRLLLLLASLVIQVDLSDSVVNTLECIVFKLFFVENVSSEKDSIIGTSRLDGLRTAAMEVLLGIFTSKPAQRRGIYAEFLTSLEKLPISKQNARQFKLSEGGIIQHASALIMRLIQISTIVIDGAKESRRMHNLNEIIPANITKIDYARENVIGPDSKLSNEIEPITKITHLKIMVAPLIKAAKSDATYVIEFIVARAITTTKGMESPYRHLLDFFVQDFITCLGSIDWPSAELLLRFLLFKMIEISKSPKASSVSRNMALDVLSQMGPKISELLFHSQKMVKSVEYCQSELGNNLTNVVELFFEKKTSETQTLKFDSEVLSWSRGPFRICLESLEDRSSEKLVSDSAIAFIKVEWANRLLESFDHIEDDNWKLEKEYGDLAQRIQEVIKDDKWFSREYGFNNKPTSSEIRLAHTLILLSSPFCQYLDHILNIFLTSMNSGQAMVQAKSLKCLTQLLDTDPSIIDRHPWVKDQMVARLEDVSSSVRENALGLVSKLISLRPSLETDMVPEVLKRLNDANVGVRKRAIKLSKEIYIRNSKHHVRVKIAKTILWKTADDEPSIQELARQTLEDIWLSPLHQAASVNDISPQFKLGRTELVSLIVETTETSDGTLDKLLADKLDKALTHMLSSTSKSYEANTTVFKALVESMFETVIDSSSGTSKGAHSRIGCFHILQIFATSKPKLFTVEHIQILHPYVANLSSTDNAAIYNSVVNIFKQTLPYLSGIQESLLITIRNDLLKSLARLRIAQLDDVIACMSIISKTLQNFDNLTRVLISGLETINKLKNSELKDDDALKKLLKLLPIVGLLGKHCDFESRRYELSVKFPSLQHGTVPKLITDIIIPLASKSYPIELRKSALQATGYICFSWPQNFSYMNVYTAFEQAFEENEMELETVALEAFKCFLVSEENRSELERENPACMTVDSKAKLGVMGGSNGDGIALSIAQRFLYRIITVSLSSQEEKLTLLSTEIIASVARQGLVHPKQPGVALIILGTTAFTKVAKIAYEEHIALHAKHETLFERDYMTAVQGSYDYQRDIVNDTRGAWTGLDNDISGMNYTSKLSRMVQVLNDLSKPKTRKKFYENICLQLDRNKPRKDASEKQLTAREDKDHIKFSQYVVENIAFFEYKTFDELIFTLHVIERFVSSAGTDIARAIEQEILPSLFQHPPLPNENIEDFEKSIKAADSIRLKQLTAASIPLLLLWEVRSYLRHQYGLVSNKREGKVKSWKDLTIKPSKVSGFNGDKFWQQSSIISRALVSEDSMTDQCRNFVELLNFDHEIKVTVSEDDDCIEPRITPEIDDDQNVPGTSNPPEIPQNRKRKFVNDNFLSSHKKHHVSKGICKITNVVESNNEL
ncbi:Protein rad9 [Erysiphe neolycopersici]|uniref:Sister chromatid cohesion protein n=1 Tax=Erysiphe neolycopersici TaxID=212602 RepID=A0A420HUA7_9PEZI|nr:Protein rad9 [Erysiphe neolycopersici]